MSLRIHLFAAIFLTSLFTKLQAQTFGCVDSAVLNIKHVSCNGLHNASITILEVFGGVAPYYFSKDGVNWSNYKVFDKLKSGSHQLFIIDGDSCIYQTKVQIDEPPLLQVHIVSNKSIVKPGESFKLSAVVEPENIKIKDIVWRNPDYFPNRQNLEQTISIFEEQEIYVGIQTPLGCTASAFYTQQVEKNSFYSPNIFKPGSNENGYFTLFTAAEIFSISSLEIFDRWGTRVFNRNNFSPNDPLNGWNGRFNNKKVSNGVYVWVAHLEYSGGRRELVKGDVVVNNFEN
jgi:CHU_C Type IX secretion signal domain